MFQIDETTVPHRVASVESQEAVWIGGGNLVRYEAVGEAYNPEQMQRVIASVQGRTDALLAAWLVPDPQNLSNPNAVVVWMLGGKVGYLPRELALTWRPILERLRARYGVAVACPGTLDPPSAANQGGFGVAVWLPALEAPRQQGMPPPVPGAPQRAAPPIPASAQGASAIGAQTTSQSATAASEELARTLAALKAAKQELESVEEALEIQSFGFYRPRYGFESSEQYVARLKAVRDEQQAMIKEDRAAPCETTWTVGGSAAEGKKMVKQQAKLMLRAFNGESDAAIAKVRYDNVTKLEQRVKKAFDDLNKLGGVQRVFIAARYLDLKLAELYLVHEHREKVQAEKDEQKRIREQMREEQKAEEELARAKAEAEKDEEQKSAALEKARLQLAEAEATSKQHAKLESLVTRLETELKDALDRKAKAIARAQLTKSGHVYVLSNIGSFGEGVYKIGMTRRLDPFERVDELGDASVPFPFDVHAIIFAEDAPGLENKLHQAFASRRVNGVNLRKEYFRVTLDEVRVEVEKLHGLVTFTLSAEAEEYRKTLAAVDAAGDLGQSPQDPAS
ncbi:MAG: DUF4041 domain-containing protein [Deltaproteobacteria bacterium]|nr:DUF4041 domain-containing protein [Deltaproteobacteria bacterium]